MRDLGGRLIRTFEYSYVRWHARGSSLRRSRWSVLLRSSVAMLFALLVVVAMARASIDTCAIPVEVQIGSADPDVPADLVVPTGRVLVVLVGWLVAIVLAILALRRVVVIGQRRSMWMYPNWHRRIQGAVASTAGRSLMVGGMVAILAVAAAGWCEVPEWFGLLIGCALFTGLLLAVFGSAVSTEAGWVAFGLVVVIDLLSATLLAGYAVLDPENSQPALIGALAFSIQAVCTSIACRWSYVVGTTPGARADDRAKAGETGRSLCALWVLLLIAALVVIFDEDLVGRAVSLLTSPVVVALTLGALAVTLGAGHTKYVEAREAARRRMQDRRSARTTIFDRRDDLVPRIAARMIASCGPLPTTVLAGGVNRMAAFELRDRQLRRELAGTGLLARQADDVWDLADGVDPAPHRWPSDRKLQELAGGRDLGPGAIADLLDEAGYQGLPLTGYLRDSHPLVRSRGRRWVRRWSVLPGRLLQ